MRTHFTMVRYSWLPLENCSIRLMKIGPYDFDQPSKIANPQIMIIIPGSPGICSYYEQFAKCLYNKQKNLTVCVLSHLHHDYEEVTDERHRFSLKHASLNNQVDHKLEFITKYIPKSASLFLAGHSIGAYMLLQKLEPLIEQHNYQVLRCFLLFPVFEHITKTPRGWACNLACNLRLHYPLIMLAHFLYYVPDCIKRWLIEWRAKSHNSSNDTGDCEMHQDLDHLVAGTKTLLDSRVVFNVLRMLMDELEMVNDPDLTVFERYGSRMTLIYGNNDGWCPKEFYESALQRQLASKILMCSYNVEHAFVINHSHDVAEMVSSELNEFSAMRNSENFSNNTDDNSSTG